MNIDRDVITLAKIIAEDYKPLVVRAKLGAAIYMVSFGIRDPQKDVYKLLMISKCLKLNLNIG